MKTYSVKEAAEILSKTQCRIRQMILADKNPRRRKTHFPGVYLCECGQSYRIPKKDIENIRD